AATGVALASSAASPVAGQSVTFTAVVSATAPGAGMPGGIVTFFDGATTLGTGTLSGGQASLSTSGLAVGGHTITAAYGGDADLTGSTSAALSETVNQAAAGVALGASTAAPVFGQSITFTATVSATGPGAGTPTGTVTFNDGAATLGTATVNASGQASFTTSGLAVGSHSVTAAYGGDS